MQLYIYEGYMYVAPVRRVTFLCFLNNKSGASAAEVEVETGDRRTGTDGEW